MFDLIMVLERKRLAVLQGRRVAAVSVLVVTNLLFHHQRRQS